MPSAEFHPYEWPIYHQFKIRLAFETLWGHGRGRAKVGPKVSFSRYIDVSEMMHMDERGAVYS